MTDAEFNVTVVTLVGGNGINSESNHSPKQGNVLQKSTPRM